ncbi:hypothetical protein BASA81_004175 [Batrachochytrium salamandrivorans]|nr:hypothetical protein BASA81_004175 [Batrachochytrium salamandrivorans]
MQPLFTRSLPGTARSSMDVDEEEEHHVNMDDFRQSSDGNDYEFEDEPPSRIKRAKCTQPQPEVASAFVPVAAVVMVQPRRPQPMARPTFRRSNSVLNESSASLFQPNFGNSPAQPYQTRGNHKPLTRSSSCTLFSSSSSFGSACRRSIDFNADEEGEHLSPPAILESGEEEDRFSPPEILESGEQHSRHSPPKLVSGEESSQAFDCRSPFCAPVPVPVPPYFRYYEDDEEGERMGGDMLSNLQLNPRPVAMGTASVGHSSSSSKNWKTPTRTDLYQGQCADIDASRMIKQCQDTTDLVVFDLDQTLLCIHTNSKFVGTGKDLAEHIRPMFYVIIPLLLANGICVGIATFSDQEALVESMLLEAFPRMVHLEQNCFVRGSRKGEAMYQHHSNSQTTSMDDDQYGKRAHIQCILNRSGKAGVAPNRVLFVDDNAANVAQARLDGHRTVHFEELSELQFFSQCGDALMN